MGEPRDDDPDDDGQADAPDADSPVDEPDEEHSKPPGDAEAADEDGADEGTESTAADDEATDAPAADPDDEPEPDDEVEPDDEAEPDDGTDGAGEDADDGPARSPAPDPLPSAEEWLEEHGGEEEAPGPPAPPAPEDDEDADDEQAANDDSDEEEIVDARAAEPVSTTDPGKNAPAGMGKPAPAGAGSGSGGGGGSSAFPDFDENMAPGDQEQPLTEHIEEMTWRFLFVALVMGVVGAGALLWADQMINFLWYSFLGPNDGTCPGPQCPLQWRPHVYHPLSLLLARLKMAALVGFVAGLPVAVYQAYRFMRPGLYPHERRYYLAAVPTSLVLAVTGVAFAYYVVLPSLFIYFSAYSTQAAELAFALSDTFGLMVMMLGFFAVVFQIPLLVMLAIMMGVTTRRWLEQRRLYFWTGFGGVAFLFSPDPTGMAPLLVALTMIALFEGTLMLLRWTERSVAIISAKTMERKRPHAWALAAFAGYVVSSLPVPDGYFGQLPPAFVDTLADWGYLGLTPAVVAVIIIGTFEVLGWIARRVSAGQGRRTGLRVRLAFIRIRPYIWLVGIVLGYMASPDPELLEVFRDVSFSAPIAVGVVVGLIAIWELVRLALSYVRPE